MTGARPRPGRSSYAFLRRWYGGVKITNLNCEEITLLQKIGIVRIDSERLSEVRYSSLCVRDHLRMSGRQERRGKAPGLVVTRAGPAAGNIACHGDPERSCRDSGHCRQHKVAELGEFVGHKTVFVRRFTTLGFTPNVKVLAAERKPLFTYWGN